MSSLLMKSGALRFCARTVKQVRQKLYDEWGERATLSHSLDKQIATLKALGALENQKTGGLCSKKT
jgi:hypothetical protein